MMQTAMMISQAPFSQESEEAVLGAVLVNDSAFLDVAAFLTSEDFYLTRHRYIWDAFTVLADRREPIDTLTVAEQLRRMNALDTAGGAAYLTQLINNCETSAHAEIYGRLVERAAIRRRGLAMADDLKLVFADETISVEEVRAESEQRFNRVWDRNFSDRAESWSNVLVRQMDGVEDRMDHPDRLMGVPTGFHELDELLAGLQRTDLILVGARPAMGKTSLLLGMGMNTMRLNVRVGLFSLEMNRDQIGQRMVAAEMDLNLQKIRLGALDPMREWPKYVQAVGRVGALPFTLDDRAGLTMLALRATALRWQRQTGLDLVMVDYLQLLTPERDQRRSNEYEDLTIISRSLKELARELNVPIVAAVQLNRDLEKRQDKRPQLSDLRGSGALEQDADVVMFLYRDVVYNEATEFPNRADIIVAKHRNGPTGLVSLHFDKSCTKFSDKRTTSIDLSALGYAGHNHYDAD